MYLSICIPTYNRAPYLDYLLNNIVAQIIENNLQQVEIVISDNASIDNTESMVNKYRIKFENIRYYRQESNLGFNANLLNAINLAQGEYCWLFGDDDRFESQAIIKVLNYLKQYTNLTGITINSQGYSFDFSQKLQPFFSSHQSKLYTASDVLYAEIGGYLSFLGGQVIAKKYLTEIINNKNFSHLNNYIHTYILAEIIKQHPNWLYVGECLVGWRSGNDSFVMNSTIENHIKRMRVDYELIWIAADVFGEESVAYKKNLNFIGAKFIRGKLLDIKMCGYKIWRLFPEITKLFAKTPSYYTKLLPVFLLPRFMIQSVRFINRRVRFINR